ncbi:MAG: DNA replication/repair protein RecF [Geminicoccaceae bacterium]
MNEFSLYPDSDADAGPVRAIAVKRLQLHDFRNYGDAAIEPQPGPVVLYGENGAGKTNLLEAVSMLSPGRGLRGVKLAEMDREGAGPWRLRALLEGHEGPCEIETSHEREAERRGAILDGRPLRGQNALGEHVSLLWLTPAMDRLFAESAGGRRRFLDRLVLSLDPAHAGRVAAYERAARERSHLLRAGRRDPAWLSAIEKRMAESAVAVTAARRELVSELDGELAQAPHHFPRPHLVLDGELEEWLDEEPAVEVEQRLAETLAGSREEDAQAGGTAVGPHRSDLVATDAWRGEAAARCSTGRQKAYLISILLAQARLRLRRWGDLPMLLLDEVTAHLDPRRRSELLAVLGELGAQCWLTGTEARLFDALARSAHFFHVVDGALTPHE